MSASKLESTLTVTSPVSGRFVRANRILQSHPQTLLTEPYGEGWILQLEGLDSAAILGRRPAPPALEHMEHDARRFRRTMALRLLSESGATAAPDPAKSLRDLRQVLCGAYYVGSSGSWSTDPPGSRQAEDAGEYSDPWCGRLSSRARSATRWAA